MVSSTMGITIKAPRACIIIALVGIVVLFIQGTSILFQLCVAVDNSLRYIDSRVCECYRLVINEHVKCQSEFNPILL